MITCTRRLQFSAGHRVFGHESKCANLHGHNYVVFIHARAPELDSIGRVIDFSVLKERYGHWIDRYWDHGMILDFNDPIIYLYQDSEQLAGLKVWYEHFNPTAENMARWLLEMGPALMRDTGIEIFKITLWETENCYAEIGVEPNP